MLCYWQEFVYEAGYTGKARYTARGLLHNQKVFLDRCKRISFNPDGQTMSVEKITGSRKVRIYKLTKYRLHVKEARCMWFWRCAISNRILFMKPAVKLTRVITGPGSPVLLDYWVSPKEYTLLQLSGKLEGTVYDFWRQ